jgi:tRNA-specific 2-thiouridylase
MKKVVLGLSGGVDSAVAALLLQRRGFDVTGLWLDFGCGSPEAARQNAEQLGIELIEEDVSQRHRDYVRRPFIKAYLSGKTPNPCIVCNPLVKFRALLEQADRLGAKHIATGHYARVEQAGRWRLLEAESDNDQSYMLYRLSQEALSRLLLPLGSFKKAEIRQMASAEGLSAAQAKDSMDICFVPDGDYAAYIEGEGCFSSPGNFIDKSGRILGRHGGVHRHTVGQRRGLGVSAESRLYVGEIRPDRAEVVLYGGADMQISRLSIADINWVSMEHANQPLRAEVKVRHSRAKYSAEIIPDGEEAEIVFDSPVRRPSAGQSAVAYMDGAVLCGGFITGVFD